GTRCGDRSRPDCTTGSAGCGAGGASPLPRTAASRAWGSGAALCSRRAWIVPSSVGRESAAAERCSVECNATSERREQAETTNRGIAHRSIVPVAGEGHELVLCHIRASVDHGARPCATTAGRTTRRESEQDREEKDRTRARDRSRARDRV